MLSLRECLAILVGTGPRNRGCLGLASDILGFTGQNAGDAYQEVAFFENLPFHHTQFPNLKGLGPAARSRLMAAFEVALRYARYTQQLKEPVHRTSSQMRTEVVQSVSADLRCEKKEWLGFVPVLGMGTVGPFCLVENGVRTHVNTDPVEFFARLLLMRPVAYFLVHNHPSGSLEPSIEDRQLTETLRDLSIPFGISLVDHLIVSVNGHRWMGES